jgi:hypothetical protein
MTSAELVFKDGFAPSLTTGELRALLRACETDDPRLTQGSTTTPPPLHSVRDWPCEAGCANGFMAMHSDRPEVPVLDPRECQLGVPKESVIRLEDGREGYRTVGECEAFFARRCFEADERLGEPTGCRHFLNWFDDTPRPEMLATLAGWVRDVLGGRPGEPAYATPA